MNEVVKFNCDKFTIIEDDPRFITCKFFFGLVGENYNGSILEKEDYENNKNTIGYTPICGYFKGKDYDEHHPKERPLGGLLSFADCDYKYEEYNDNLYACAKGIIAKEYLSDKEIESILKNDNKKISIEIEVLDKEKLPNGKFKFKSWIYQCITIIGDKYSQGMKLAHLEVLNNPKEKYASFVESTIETFSKKIEIEDKYSKKEVDGMKKEVIEKVSEKFSLNSAQIREIFNNALNQYKYKNGDYEWCRYWLEAYDEEFIYVYDSQEEKAKRMKYQIADNVATIDTESAEDVISAGYMPVGSKTVDDEYETLKVSYSELKAQFTELEEKFNKKSEEIDTANTTFAEEKDMMAKDVTAKQDTIITMGQDMDAMKEKMAEMQKMMDEMKSMMAEKEKEMMSKDEEITKYIKKDKELQAEKFISQYAEKLTEIEVKEFKEKVHTFATIEEFQKDLKAFVCDKYEDEVKGKSTNASFSNLGYFPINHNKQPNETGTWVDYLDIYKTKTN